MELVVLICIISLPPPSPPPPCIMEEKYRSTIIQLFLYSLKFNMYDLNNAEERSLLQSSPTSLWPSEHQSLGKMYRGRGTLKSSQPLQGVFIFSHFTCKTFSPTWAFLLLNNYSQSPRAAQLLTEIKDLDCKTPPVNKILTDEPSFLPVDFFSVISFWQNMWCFATRDSVTSHSK